LNFAASWAVPLVWAQYFAPTEISFLLAVKWFLWLAVAFFGLYPLIVAYMVWAERKVAARFQDRIGPNRVGPLGLLQPIADLIKLITKEDIVPRTADGLVHLLAPILLIISAFMVLAVVPLGLGYLDSDTRQWRGIVPVDPPAGLVYLLAVSSISTLGVFLAGWSSRNKYSLLGAMRAVAQLISYEIPQVLATIPIVLWTGSLSLVVMMNKQLEYGWFLFSPPGLLAFAILTIASIAEVNRTPFDLPEAESEIIAGYHTEYSGMRFGLFFLAEYMSVFGVSCLGTVLFLGGGTLPFTTFPFLTILTETSFSYILCNVLSVSLFAIKVLGYIFLMFWIRVTLPRMRVDRLMNFSWKVLIPLSIVNILIAAIWYEFVLRPPVHSYWNIPLLLFSLPIDANVVEGWLVTLVLVLLSVWGMLRIFRGTTSVPQVMPAPRVALRPTAAR